MFILTILALVVMVYHTKVVYVSTVGGAREFLAWVYAIVLDGGILVSVLRSKYSLSSRGVAWWSIFYAAISFGVNICLLFLVPGFWPRIIIAVMLPFTIAYFSHEVPKTHRRKNDNKG